MQLGSGLCAAVRSGRNPGPAAASVSLSQLLHLPGPASASRLAVSSQMEKHFLNRKD